MKKQYINPALSVVHVGSGDILASSGNLGIYPGEDGDSGREPESGGGIQLVNGQKGSFGNTWGDEW